MDLIRQNPYRVLGVLSNTSKKEIAANYGKIKAFTKTGKTISFENDFSLILGPIVRTEESSVIAYNSLSLPKDRVLAGLFWFISGRSVSDMIALRSLRGGQIDKVTTILGETSTMSSCINLATINIIRQNWAVALYYYTLLLNDSEKRLEFLSSIIDNPDLLSENEIIRLFVDKLLQSFPDVPWLEYLNQTEILVDGSLCDVRDFFRNSNLYEYFSKRCIELSIRRIEFCLSQAAESEGCNAKKNLNAAKKLEEDTRILLRSLRRGLGKGSNEYKSYCDRIANQVVDNCIEYYNNDTNNPIRSRNILNLLKFALRIAEGKITKDRCQDNYNQIKHEYDELIPEEIDTEIKYINKQIAEFNKLNLVSNYAGYLDAVLGSCFQKLEIIKTNVGENSPHYVKTSSDIVNFGISVIINEVNKSLKAYKSAHNYENARGLLELRNKLKWGKPIFNTLKTFVKDSTCESQYEYNLNLFIKLYDEYHVDNLDVENVVRLTIKVDAPESVFVGQQFIVVFKVDHGNYDGDLNFAPPSFNGLEVLLGPSISKFQNGTKYVYILIARTVGIFTITSASVKLGTSITKSLPQTIKILGEKTVDKSKRATANNSTSTSTNDAPKRNTKKSIKKDSKIGLIFGLILVAFVMYVFIREIGNFTKSKSEYNTTQNSKISADESIVGEISIDEKSESLEDSESLNRNQSRTYKIVYFKTGDKPYLSFYGKGQYDSGTKNSLLIKNGSGRDAVVFLESLSRVKIRHVYIRKGESFRMTQIPGGKYITKIYQGDKWNPNKNNSNIAPLGGFMENISMTKSENGDSFDYPFPSSGYYYDYEITLNKVINGNMRTETIDADEMF